MMSISFHITPIRPVTVQQIQQFTLLEELREVFREVGLLLKDRESKISPTSKPKHATPDLLLGSVWLLAVLNRL